MLGKIGIPVEINTPVIGILTWYEINILGINKNIIRGILLIKQLIKFNIESINPTFLSSLEEYAIYIVKNEGII